MNLGIASGSYIFTAGFGWEKTLEERDEKTYRWELLEAPLRYYEPFQGGHEFVFWWINRGGYYHKKYGLYGIHSWLQPGDLDDPEYWAQVMKEMKRNKIVFSHYGSPLTFTYTPIETFKEQYLPEIVRHMELCEQLECKIFNLAGPNTTWNRFRNRPMPLDKRLRSCSDHLRLIAEAGSSYDFVVTIENHADYRVSEILKIIEMSGAKDVMINFDTGNTAMTIEDPIEAAKLAAPRTISTHIKDVKVDTPTYYGGRYLVSPIGRGDIDYRELLTILENEAPDPKNITLNVETHTLEGVEDEIVDESLRYLSTEMRDFLR